MRRRAGPALAQHWSGHQRSRRSSSAAARAASSPSAPPLRSAPAAAAAAAAAPGASSRRQRRARRSWLALACLSARCRSALTPNSLMPCSLDSSASPAPRILSCSQQHIAMTGTLVGQGSADEYARASRPSADRTARRRTHPAPRPGHAHVADPCCCCCRCCSGPKRSGKTLNWGSPHSSNHILMRGSPDWSQAVTTLW